MSDEPEKRASTTGARAPAATSNPPIASQRPAAGGSMHPVTSSDAGDPLIGRTINDRVKIIRTLARGGMGKVYLGEQLTLGRPCAIKVLDPKVAAQEGEDFAKRFLLEASVTSKLTHPNAITIFDYGETEEGICYIAMEFLDGKTLADELKAHGRISPERAISISRQICRALREAHSLGVVHRDLKPGNIFLVNQAAQEEEADFIKVLDFGLVKETKHEGNDGLHTQVGQIMGSPRYMAPEQIQGKDVDARTDIYSLGAVLFAMLTGKPPFERANEMATMMAHVSEPVPALGIVVPDLMLPRGLEEIVFKCLEKDPGKRFSSMEELLVALKISGPPVRATTTGSGQHAAAYVTGSGSGSGTHRAVDVAALTAPAPQKKAFSPVWIVVGVVAVAIAAIVFFTRAKDEPKATGGPGSATQTTAPPPPSSVAVAPASIPTPVKSVAPLATSVLKIETDPPGARVREEGVVKCELTPCEITYVGNEADAAMDHVLEFLKADYRKENKIVHAGGIEPFKLKMTKQ